MDPFPDLAVRQRARGRHRAGGHRPRTSLAATAGVEHGDRGTPAGARHVDAGRAARRADRARLALGRGTAPRVASGPSRRSGKDGARLNVDHARVQDRAWRFTPCSAATGPWSCGQAKLRPIPPGPATGRSGTGGAGAAVLLSRRLADRRSRRRVSADRGCPGTPSWYPGRRAAAFRDTGTAFRGSR